VAHSGLQKQSKEETLQLLLAAHFPDLVAAEEMVAFAAAHSADEMGRKPVHITGARCYGRGSGSQIGCIYFVFLYSYYLSIVQINPFRPRPSHSTTESQTFLFSLDVCSWSTLAGGTKKFFSAGSEPTLGRPGCSLH